MSVDFPNEAARCQRFCPKGHKVISSHEAKTDLPPPVSEVISAATGRPTCPSRNIQMELSKWNEPALTHKCVNLCLKRRRFRRPKVIVDHDPCDLD